MESSNNDKTRFHKNNDLSSDIENSGDVDATVINVSSLNVAGTNNDTSIGDSSVQEDIDATIINVSSFNADDSNSGSVDIDSLDSDVTRVASSSQNSIENESVGSFDETIFQTGSLSSPQADSIVDNSVQYLTDRSSQYLSNLSSNSHNPDQTQFFSQKKPSETISGQNDKRILKQRFVLQDVLGSGGMGMVYKAQDMRKVEAHDRDPYVAVKVLNDDFKSHPDAFIALQRESRKSQVLAHPNIVTVYDFDRDGEQVFMTMEYMEGQPLDEILKKKRSIGLDKNTAKNIISDICQALIHAHREHVIHSDFKPGNIFVTKRGLSKVFDFGISRAVSKVEHSEGDKTVFDPGSLGALTPTYASYEMLTGEEPDLRDDIYALGCVIYELYTGRHPFNRQPADKAFDKGLKPQRIKSLKRREWRSLEKALEFKRDARLESVSELYQAFFPSRKVYLLPVATIAVIAVVASIIYSQVTIKEQQKTAETQLESVRSEVELQLHQEQIQELLAAPEFGSHWEVVLDQKLDAVKQQLSSDDNWLIGAEAYIFKLYLAQAKAVREAGDLENAQVYLKKARRYRGDVKLLVLERGAINQEQHRKDLAYQQEQARIAQDLEKEEAAQANSLKFAEDKRKRQQEASNRKQINKIAGQIDQNLNCETVPDMMVLKQQVKSLKKRANKMFRNNLPGYEQSLSNCIKRIALDNEVTAQKIKIASLKIFSGSKAILNTELIPRDSCTMGMAGKGSRGLRSTCRDTLKQGGKAPRMLVIPDTASQPAFAIGKYEVSWGEFNQYCHVSGECSVAESVNEQLPVTGVSIEQARSYISWLNTQTWSTYNLPTKEQWLSASQAENSEPDPNRNCQVEVRGIRKGVNLLSARSGQQNAWGMVNHLGNAREWVTLDGQLFVQGGSHKDPIKDCISTLSITHQGKADAITGFRIARALR